MRLIIVISGILASFHSLSFSVKKIGDLVSQLDEASGLEYYNGKIITHTDSGGESNLYIIREDGTVERTIQISNAKNRDWEELTAAPDGRFFIGDIGNNNNSRKECQIYVLKKGFLEKKSDEVTAEKIVFSYEDQKAFPPSKENLYYDAEAMFWMNDSIYILSKCRSKPFTGRSFVYVLPDKPGSYKARKIGEIPFCSSGWMWCSVTAADYDAQSNTLAVLLYGKLILIKNFKKNNFWEGDFETLNFHSLKQREAITFIDSESWYLCDEKSKMLGGGFLYKVTKK